ncbi:MAG TPA: hypothetical protein VK666_18235, partial [Chryseolinea sp.]|nr:hypothetical protein [Chryseolinea sp.]
MKRSILILVVIVAACAGGILGSLFTIKFFGLPGASYTSIEGRQQSMLTGYSRDTAYRVPEGM